MANFHDSYPLPLNVQFINSEKSWRLIQPFSFIDKNLGTINVPFDFKTNGLTLYRVPILMVLFINYGFPAAVIHDYLYSRSGVARSDADNVFYNALRATGVARWRASLMYLGVRLFGRFYYNKQ